MAFFCEQTGIRIAAPGVHESVQPGGHPAVIDDGEGGEVLLDPTREQKPDNKGSKKPTKGQPATPDGAGAGEPTKDQTAAPNGAGEQKPDNKGSK